MGYLPIEDHGIIGNLHTVALVGVNGAIDFMSFPRFDSPTIFAAILDDRKGGSFQITPVLDQTIQKQIYLPETNILLSRFLADQGVAELSDFMPLVEGGNTHCIVRRVKTVRGEMRYRMICEPRFDYGRAQHRVEVKDREAIFTSQGRDGTALRLRSDLPLREQDGAAVAEFVLAAGESAGFILEEVRPESPASGADFVSASFKDTANYWRRWIRRSTYRGRWLEMVNRSALTLKLLTSQKHGSIVAAPTFGLPEEVGGERNWDYRYTWVRDASFSLYALMRLGFTDEARAFMDWIEARCHELQPDGTLQVMYGIDGRHDLSEEILAHFEGYQGSRPVRIGNNAYNQMQLDIYGELLDSVYIYDKYGTPISHDLWQQLVRLADWVCRNWCRKDAGIWEIRGDPQEFLCSRLMCWVAIDRAIRLSVRRSLPAPIKRWREERDKIYRDIFENFWDDEQHAFVQFKGSKALDAANLLMPLLKLIGPTDPRWISTLRAVEKDLVEDSLVHRYKIGAAAKDGLAGEEGSMSICSFWYVECLSRAGDPQQARFYFEKMLGYANHVGLYSEMLGHRAQHLGNFPQALTHIGLISAACNLDRILTEASNPGMDR